MQLRESSCRKRFDFDHVTLHVTRVYIWRMVLREKAVLFRGLIIRSLRRRWRVNIVKGFIKFFGEIRRWQFEPPGRT